MKKIALSIFFGSALFMSSQAFAGEVELCLADPICAGYMNYFAN